MRETRLKSRSNSLNRSINKIESKTQLRFNKIDLYISKVFNKKKDDLLPAKCECAEHCGKEMINRSFNLNVDYLFECLFSRNQFNTQFAKLRKLTRNFEHFILRF